MVGSRYNHTPWRMFIQRRLPGPTVRTAHRHEDVDRHFDHAKQFGARIVKPPNNMPFGERQYVAEDLAGHRWVFSQSVANVAPEKWGATTPQSKK